MRLGVSGELIERNRNRLLGDADSEFSREFGRVVLQRGGLSAVHRKTKIPQRGGAGKI